MSVIFQNITQIKNRYPDNAWLEIIGNCDTQLFLGCTDEMTAKFISDRTGEVTIRVESMAKELTSMRITNYTPSHNPSHKETSSIGKRKKLLTPDEVLRLPCEDALVIFRGQNVLKVKKFDFTKHPESKKMRDCNARDYIPNWRLEKEQLKILKSKLTKPPMSPAPEPQPTLELAPEAGLVSEVVIPEELPTAPPILSPPVPPPKGKSRKKAVKVEEDLKQDLKAENSDLNINEPYKTIGIDDLLAIYKSYDGRRNRLYCAGHIRQ